MSATYVTTRSDLRRFDLVAAAFTIAWLVLAAGAIDDITNSMLPSAALLLVGTAIAARHQADLERATISAEDVLVMTAVVLVGPLSWLVAAGVVVAPAARWPLRAAIWNVVTIGVPAGLAAALLGTGTFDLVRTTAALLAYVATNFLMGSLAPMLTSGMRVGDAWRVDAAALLGTGIVSAAMALLVGAAELELGPAALVLLVIPTIAVQALAKLMQRQLRLADRVTTHARELARTNLQFATAMVRALDARDAYTAGHSAAVAVYARDLAAARGLDGRQVRIAQLAGLLHDIGKIGVPGAVLNKRGPLDAAERELMDAHPVIGAEILGDVNSYRDLARIVRHHHERIDGAGYPDRLAGADIPLLSRVLAVADTWSALTTDRPYRDGMNPTRAASILREAAGDQLDPELVDTFLQIIDDADDFYRRGRLQDFDVQVARMSPLADLDDHRGDALAA